MLNVQCIFKTALISLFLFLKNKFSFPEAALYHGASRSGLYSPPSSSTSSSTSGRLSTDQALNAYKRDSKSADSKRSLDLSKHGSRHEEAALSKVKCSKDHDKKDERTNKRQCELSPTRGKKAKILKTLETDIKKQDKISPKENLSALDSNQASSEIKVAIEDCKKIDKDNVLVDLSIKIPKSEIISPKAVKASPTSSVTSSEEKSSPNSTSGECLYLFYLSLLVKSHFIYLCQKCPKHYNENWKKTFFFISLYL